MKLKTHLCFFILLLVAFNLSAKPRPSLFMSMEWVNGIVYNQPADVYIEIASQISSEQMRFSLNLPDGVTLIDGELAFERKIEKGQPLSLTYTLMIENNAAGDVEAEASIGDSSQVFFRAAKKLTITPSNVSQVFSQTLKARAVSPSFHHTERNGVKLREYKLP